MTSLSRRTLFRSAALGAATTLPAALAPIEAAAQGHAQGAPAPAPASNQPTFYRFFNPAEAAFIEAAVDRLIPDDARWRGALWAGVAHYIDGQLFGAYGQGARFYAAGPWAAGTPSQGYQMALNPAQLYRAALTAIRREEQRRRLDFAGARPEAKDAFLRELEAGAIDCGGFPSSIFFETLLANTIEGFFADPSYGGNRDMVGWRMIGFPGAYAAYLSTYTQHGVKFTGDPVPIGAHQPGGHGGHGGHGGRDHG